MTTTTLRLVKPLPIRETRPADPQPRFNLRATLPDRPGALGAVAAALRRAGADIVSISVVEPAPFDAGDDITIALPATVLLHEGCAAPLPGGVGRETGPRSGGAGLEILDHTARVGIALFAVRR